MAKVTRVYRIESRDIIKAMNGTLKPNKRVKHLKRAIFVFCVLVPLLYCVVGKSF